MKAKIEITGQISGNFRLRNAVITPDCEEYRGMFNSFILKFRTKKDAYKALWEGYKYLRREYPDPYLHYNKKKSLSYDASIAKISSGN